MAVEVAAADHRALAADVERRERIQLAAVGDADDHAELLLHGRIGGGRSMRPNSSGGPRYLSRSGRTSAALTVSVGNCSGAARPHRAVASATGAPSAVTSTAGDAVIVAHARDIVLDDFDHRRLPGLDRRGADRRWSLLRAGTVCRVASAFSLDPGLAHFGFRFGLATFSHGLHVKVPNCQEGCYAAIPQWRDKVQARSSSASSPPAQPMNDSPIGQPSSVPAGILDLRQSGEARGAGQPHHAHAEIFQIFRRACRPAVRWPARSAAPKSCPEHAICRICARALSWTRRLASACALRDGRGESRCAHECRGRASVDARMTKSPKVCHVS